jgi:hypothetical protein
MLGNDTGANKDTQQGDAAVYDGMLSEKPGKPLFIDDMQILRLFKA